MFQTYLTDGTTWESYISGSQEANGYLFRTNISDGFRIFWSNHDIVTYEDTSVVYLAASEPVPVDDSKLTLFGTTITWNGDTTGLPNFSVEGFGTFYKVSDKVFAIEELTGATYDGGGNLADYTGMATGADGYDGFGLVFNINTEALIALSAQAGSYEDGFVVVPEDGTYVRYISGDGVIGWLSALYLPNAFGGSITSTTATVNFTCSDLLYTDSVYRIKAWVYEPSKEVLFDGSATTADESDVAPVLYTSAPVFNEGDTLIVEFEGVTYKFVAQDFSEVIGTQAACVGELLEDNSEPSFANYPFFIVSVSINGFLMIYTEAAGTYALKVSKVGSGGLDTTLEPTWTSELFAGTSHSESHTFTGLTPATDYAVYGVIWSETDAAATGGNATTTFTTLTSDTGGTLHLITDRTQADVDRLEALMTKGWDKLTEAEQQEYLDVSHKGAYNASDLNRVGAAINYVAELLTEWGYPYYPDMRTNWTAAEYFYAADLREYLAAVEGLRQRLAVFADTPNTPDWVRSHQQANDIEKIVEDVHLLLQNMIAELPYADIIYSGAYPF